MIFKPLNLLVMKNAILLKDLSENAIDKILVNDQLRAGDWGFTFGSGESWFFSFTNYDNSSGTGNNAC